MKEENDNMSQELQKNPVERAKDLLNIKGEIKSHDIYKKLREYRNNIHPDRFQDEKQKSQAEEKFKEIQTLISELAAHVQQEELTATPSDLTVYKPFYDNVYFQQRLDQSQERIEQLELQLKFLREKNQSLSKELEAKVDKTLLQEMKEIEGNYKISYKNLKPIGAIFLLTSLVAIMSKIEEVSIFIGKYAPVSQHTIDVSLFIIFSFLLFLVVKQVVEYKLFSFSVSRHCSSKSTADFMEFLADRYNSEVEDIKTFSEKDAFDYIAGKSSRWKRGLAYLGVRLFHSDTCDNIKKYFINNLLHKKLIEVAEAKNLDRLFKILRPASRRRYSFEDD